MAINYTLVGWDTSKYVNPTNMNHMDEGIKAACDGVDELQEKIDKINGDAYEVHFESEQYEAENVGDALNEVNENLDTKLSANYPVITGYIASNSLTTDNKQVINGYDKAVFVGNPKLDAVHFEYDGKTIPITDFALNSDLGKELLGTKQYAGHWIYDGNSGSPYLFIPLPSFYQNYNISVSTITVQGVGSYSSDITMSKYVNAIVLKHASVTGTTHNGKLGFATITFS